MKVKYSAYQGLLNKSQCFYGTNEWAWAHWDCSVIQIKAIYIVDKKKEKKQNITYSLVLKTFPDLSGGNRAANGEFFGFTKEYSKQ